ncbi:MAG: macro domain-containing protein [Candidatus Riflebacteria bacterium]|nr:macro domain-containing protein [Candidatus Riflebacteria bacterium]
MSGTLIGSLALGDGRRFEVALADLLAESTDCIVNAANGRLAHGGGVAAAIADAAGPELVDEGDRIVEERGRIDTGGAVMTCAGRLPFKAVIHAVGPRLGEGDEESKLARALASSFSIAARQRFESISFPAVSSGIFAVPPDVCVRAYLRAVRGHWSSTPGSPLKLIRLCLFEGEVARLIVTELAEGR